MIAVITMALVVIFAYHMLSKIFLGFLILLVMNFLWFFLYLSDACLIYFFRCHISSECFISFREKLMSNTDIYRYGIPLYVHLSSGLVILILSSLLPFGGFISMIIVYIVYTFVYCFGMYNRYYVDKEAYEKVLKVNKDFYSIYIMPASAFVAISGYLATITGVTIKEGSLSVELFYLVQNLLNINSGYELPMLIILSPMLFFLFMYILSLPLQLLIYLSICLIDHMNKSIESYKKINKTIFKFLPL